jgi:hypothetical protein
MRPKKNKGADLLYQMRLSSSERADSVPLLGFLAVSDIISFLIT